MNTLNEDLVDERIERWRKNLVDTSLRNRLLDIKESRMSCLRLSGPRPQDIYNIVVENKGSFEVKLDSDGGASFAPAEKAGKTASSHEVGDRSLMLMRTKAREAVREQGINILFITIGILEWSAESTQNLKVRSPLVLIPVELTRAGPLDPYVLRKAGGEVTINPTLVHKLRSELSLTFPPLPEEGVVLSDYLDEVKNTFARLGWEVTDHSYLGLFKFPKMCMYDELGQFKELASAHPVVRSLAGKPLPEGAPQEGAQVGGGFEVLDADSSQEEAISLALSGASFVLQGPPGTGKSQTIANIITETMARGRTVLFVSEKMAALEVVKKRLDARRLGDYCLELHDHGQGRQEVVEELSRCLAFTTSTDVRPSDHEELERVRSNLDGYADALHQRRDWLNMSFYEVLCELTELQSAPEISISFPNLERMGRRDLGSLETLVRDIERCASLLACIDGHPWSDCSIGSWKLSAQSEVVRHLSSLKLAQTRLNDVLLPLARDCGLAPPTNLREAADMVAQLRAASTSPGPMPSWFEANPSKLMSLVDEVQHCYLDFSGRMRWLRERYRDDILTLDLHHMQRRFQNQYKLRRNRFFSYYYSSDMRKLRSLRLGKTRFSWKKARDDLEELVKIADVANHLHTLEAECSSMFGKHFQGEATEWGRIKSSIIWAKQYYDRYGPPKSSEFLQLLCNGVDNAIELRPRTELVEQSSARLEDALAAAGESFNLAVLAGDRSLHEVPFEALTAWAQRHLDNADRFHEWTELARVRREGAQRGLSDLLSLTAQGQLPTAGLWEGVRKRFFTLWHDLLMSQDRRLREFDSQTMDREVARFSELDRRHIDTAVSRVRAVLDARRRELCELSSPENGSGLWVLRHEVSRKKNPRPLRELFSQAMVPIQVLKPCFLMSPLSVSTFLDPSVARFDLVIFDEASQVRPEDAVGSIMRGKQLIVVGDSLQLPPTDFFREVGEDENDVPDLESILDECASALPHRMLLWHYRSRQESLIAFSNKRFYGGRLMTFPSSKLDRPGLGVEFIHVPDGQYDRARTRKNLREAEKVADLVVEHALSRTGKSLGVVAFSEPQQMAIIEELEKRITAMPSLAPLLDENGEEGFFVKNLENVQGDERDVMMFSIGYGKDSKGRIFQNFGPLNRPGGERRLNVAVTRSRENIKLISSMLPEELEGSTPGVEALRQYMEYARHVSAKNEVTSGEPPTSIQKEIKARLESRGLIVEEQVGRSLARIDLAVVDPLRSGNYLLGILTDGPSYAQNGGARDRERLRVEMLTGLGWRILRTWSQEWIKDPDPVVERIMAAVERAKQEEAERSAAEVAAKPEVLLATAETLTPVEKTECSVYARADLREEAFISLYRSDPSAALVEGVRKVVLVEGPVHVAVVRERVKEMIAAATGKKPSSVERPLGQALASLEDSGIRVDDDFLWPPGERCVAVRRSDVRRDIGHVCDAELRTMVMSCVPEKGEVEMKDVVNGVTAMLGYKRPTAPIRARVISMIAQLSETALETEKRETVTVTNGHVDSSDGEEASP